MFSNFVVAERLKGFQKGEYKSIKNNKKDIFKSIKTVCDLKPTLHKLIAGGMDLVESANGCIDYLWVNRSQCFDGANFYKYKKDVAETPTAPGGQQSWTAPGSQQSWTAGAETKITPIYFTSGGAGKIAPLNTFDLFECGENITVNEAKCLCASDSSEFGNCVVVLNKTTFQKMGIEIIVKDNMVIGIFPTSHGTFELPAGYYSGMVRVICFTNPTFC